MYKIIIVDDEEDTRQAIASTVDWEKEGYTFMGEAKNGLEALELYETFLPDVIISDIHMPYLNGLELLETLFSSYPRPRVILLTAYDEFEYAQKAVKYKAVEYLLKPISKIELTQILQRLKQELDQEFAEHENILKLKCEFEKSLPILREKLISTLLVSQMDKDELIEKLTSYNMDILNKSIIVGVVSVDTQQRKENSSNLFHKQSDEILKFAIYNIAQEIIASNNAGITFMQPDNVVLLCIFDHAENIEHSCLLMFDEIRRSVEKYLNITVTIGVGIPVSGAQDLNVSYKTAHAASNYKIVLGENRVIYINDIENCNPENYEFSDIVDQKLTTSIKIGNIDLVENMIHSIFASMVRDVKQGYYINIVEIMVSILRTAKNMGVDTQTLLGADNDILKKVLGMTDIGLVKTWIISICGDIIKMASDIRQNNSHKIITDTYSFVRENYTNSEINIQNVCKFLYISISHFCAIFKKETGDTFMNYLNNYRMNIAKEYLRTTDMKINEIAEKVGYSDPNYFSFSFKKKWGLSPREYKFSKTPEV